MTPPATRSGPRPETCEERAYRLLEEARLVCELIIAAARGFPERVVLSAIHRQLGLAGWVASSELDPDRRRVLLANAHHRLQRALPDPADELALVEAAICAEDAVADSLLEADEIEHLHLAHVHMLHAMDLLHTHLYAPELVSAKGNDGQNRRRGGSA